MFVRSVDGKRGEKEKVWDREKEDANPGKEVCGQ